MSVLRKSATATPYSVEVDTKRSFLNSVDTGSYLKSLLIFSRAISLILVKLHHVSIVLKLLHISEKASVTLKN